MGSGGIGRAFGWARTGSAGAGAQVLQTEGRGFDPRNRHHLNRPGFPLRSENRVAMSKRKRIDSRGIDRDGRGRP